MPPRRRLLGDPGDAGATFHFLSGTVRSARRGVDAGEVMRSGILVTVGAACVALLAACGSATSASAPSKTDSPATGESRAAGPSAATETASPASVSGDPLGPSSLPASYFSASAMSTYLSYVTAHWDNPTGNTPPLPAD